MKRLPLFLGVFAAIGLAIASATSGCHLFPGAASDDSPSASPTFWPAGVPTPRPPRGAPTFDASTGNGALQLSYDPPHIRIWATNVPAGTISVIYVVASTRYRSERLQIDAPDHLSSHTAMLEYDRLSAGEYTITAYLKGKNTPVDARVVHVPN